MYVCMHACMHACMCVCVVVGMLMQLALVTSNMYPDGTVSKGKLVGLKSFLSETSLPRVVNDRVAGHEPKRLHVVVRVSSLS